MKDSPKSVNHGRIQEIDNTNKKGGPGSEGKLQRKASYIDRKPKMLAKKKIGIQDNTSINHGSMDDEINDSDFSSVASKPIHESEFHKSQSNQKPTKYQEAPGLNRMPIEKQETVKIFQGKDSESEVKDMEDESFSDDADEDTNQPGYTNHQYGQSQ